MLRCALPLTGYRIDAQDGEIGRAHDLFFDDAHWLVRYLVVDTGRWLRGRRVLISPVSLGQPDWTRGLFPVALSKDQIENSPGVSSDEPVSRPREHELSDYFGWPVYWAPGMMAAGSIAGGNPPPPVVPVYGDEGAAEPRPESEPQRDPHLRSMREVSGYRIRAHDGEIGHVEDFIVDDENWAVRYVIVDTRNWLPGRTVLIAPDWFSAFDWHDGRAHTALTRDAIKDAPEFDASQPVNRDYEGRLYDYYGRPGYWTEVVPPNRELRA